MKWIEYDYVCNKDKGITIHKKVEYNEANLAIAEAEACDGYTVTDDGEEIKKNPLPVELGGTNATTADKARANIGAAPAGTGENGKLTAADVGAAPAGSGTNGKVTPSDIGAAPSTHAARHKKGGSDALTAADIGAASSTHAAQHKKGGSDALTAADIGAAPAYMYSTVDLTAGSSPLDEGKLYFVYE